MRFRTQGKAARLSAKIHSGEDKLAQSTSHKTRKGTNRRDVLRGAAAISAAAILRPVAAAAQSSSSSSYAHLPARGEYLIRGAYVITMDAKLGDLPAATSM